MSAILAQLGGNPFNTQVGQKIEHATDMSLASENWALNMEICDVINDTDEGPKDAIKAIRKRLQQNVGKNYTVVMYTLTVLETCVKNCGKRFHYHITQKDFVQDLVKLIGPKNDPPTVVQEKVLSLIQSWADAFRAIPEMQGVVQVYNDLKQKGIEFPMTDLDAMAPIHTPQRSVPVLEPQRTERVLPQEPTLTLPHSQPAQQPVAPGPVSLTPEQLAKLRSELDIVQANMKVFGEMLTELVPGKEHPSDLELLNDLRQTCHAMQSRVVQLIDSVANEEVTNELLRVNDELNNLFLRYERFDKKRSAMGSQIPKPAPVVDTKPLIDLGEDTKPDDIQVQIANMSLGNASATTTLGQLATVPATTKALEGSDEFDMFAQSRNVTYEQAKTSGSTYADNSRSDQVAGLRAITTAKAQPGKEVEPEVDLLHKLQREQDFDEMERWLEDKPTSGQESITSSEFDRFLAERAAAAETTPTTTSGVTTTTPTSRPSGNPPTRRCINHEEPENTLFAL